MSASRRFLPRPTLLALAALACFASGPIRAQTEETTDAVTVGGGLATGDRADRAILGQYDGLATRRATGLLDLRLTRRDEATDTTLRLTGHDLLGRNPALDLSWKRPGDWRITAHIGRQRHDDVLQPSDGSDLHLQRTALGLTLRKLLGPDAQLDVALSTENKTGLRAFGIGMSCPSAVAPGCLGTTGVATGSALLFVPETVDANHTQVDARIAWAYDRLRVHAGYYGSFYRNRLDSLVPSVPATLANAIGTPLPAADGLAAILARPVALAPDNQAHQLEIAGVLLAGTSTQLNFKLARAWAFQQQDFAAGGFADVPAGVTDLGGRIDTTLAQVGFSARPAGRLALSGTLRYEDRADLTPIALYNVEGSARYTNRRLPRTTLRGQLQGHWQFNSDLRGTLAATHESIDRGTFTATSAIAGVTALRQETDETGLRAELRKRLTEDFSGSIALATSRRSGSNWLRDNSGTGVTEVPNPNDPGAGLATGTFMPTLADRRRDTFKLHAEWQASDELLLQLAAQAGHDSYDVPSLYGLRSSGNGAVDLDASYALSARWNLVGTLSWSNQTLHQRRPDAALMDFDNTAVGLTVGVTGKPAAKFEVGASLAYVDDRSVFGQTLEPGADGASVALLAATGGLPDIVFRQTLLKAFGRWIPDKQSEWRIDLVHQRSTWSDWAWSYNGTAFRYSDGTTVLAPARQNVTFVGVRYVRRWP